MTIKSWPTTLVSILSYLSISIRGSKQHYDMMWRSRVINAQTYRERERERGGGASSLLKHNRRSYTPVLGPNSKDTHICPWYPDADPEIFQRGDWGRGKFLIHVSTKKLHSKNKKNHRIFKETFSIMGKFMFRKKITHTRELLNHHCSIVSSDYATKRQKRKDHTQTIIYDNLKTKFETHFCLCNLYKKQTCGLE